MNDTYVTHNLVNLTGSEQMTSTGPSRRRLLLSVRLFLEIFSFDIPWIGTWFVFLDFLVRRRGWGRGRRGWFAVVVEFSRSCTIPPTSRHTQPPKHRSSSLSCREYKLAQSRIGILGKIASVGTAFDGRWTGQTGTGMETTATTSAVQTSCSIWYGNDVWFVEHLSTSRKFHGHDL